MSDNKKYYYLKLKENFFDNDDMKLLESMDNGYLYSNILLKLYLKSLKNNGRLMFKEIIPYNTKMIATLTNHNIDIVEKAMKIFKEFNLIDVLDNGAIYLLEIENFIGKSSSEADRIRKYRTKVETEKKQLLSSHSVQMYDKCTPELELKKEIKKDNKIYTHEIINLVTDFFNYQQSQHPNIIKTITENKINISCEVVEKLIRIDKYTLDEIKNVLNFAVKDDFWKTNLLSLGSLRNKSKTNDEMKFINILSASKRVKKSKSDILYEEMMKEGEEFLRGEE